MTTMQEQMSLATAEYTARTTLGHHVTCLHKARAWKHFTNALTDACRRLARRSVSSLLRRAGAAINCSIMLQKMS